MTSATNRLTAKALSSLPLSRTYSSATYITAYQNPPHSQGYTNMFTSLSPEIKHAIFCSLPDVASLEALVLTCSSFYHTFLTAQSLVLKEIMRSQISADVISLAVVVSKSCDLRPWSRAGVLDFLSHFLEHRAPIMWTLPRALHVSHLHSHIKFFAAEFAATKLAGEAQSRPSISETHRIERTFYVFELYCNLFRARKPANKDRFSAEEQRDLFFAKFAPWENEQLACVHDYLFDRLSVAFNDVAEHDVFWGELSIAYVDDYDELGSLYKEHYLSRGLAYLRQVVSATHYDERFELIHPNLGIDGCFLFNGMSTQDGDASYLPLEDYSSAEKDKFIRNPFFADNNNGPMEAWIWAHAESTRERFYFRDDQYALRQRGYVMWDFSRISQWDCFHVPWLDTTDVIHRGEEIKRRHAAMMKSFDQRSGIYRRGGRGWWSPDDESRIIWQPRMIEKKEPDRYFSAKGKFIEEMRAWRTNIG